MPRSRPSHVLPLCLAALFAASAAPAKRPMTLEDLWAMERPGSASLSPGGSQVVYTVTRWSVEENKTDTDLWLVPADGSAPPRRLTWNPDPDNRPVWSPDGRRIAFVSKRGDAPPQLYILSLDGGEPQPVTKLPVAVQGPKWFRDGKRLGFVASTWPDLNGDWTAVQKRLDAHKADKVQAKISDTRLLRFWNEYRTDGRIHHIFSVELASGEVKDLTPGLARTLDLLAPEGTWDLAPEGDEIAYSANTTEPPYQTMNFDVFIQKITPPDTEPRNVSEANPAADLAPRYSPDGRWLVYRRGRRPEIDAEFLRLARYDRRTGEVRGLAEDWVGSPDGAAFTPDGRTLLFSAQEKGRIHLFSLDVNGGTPKLLGRGGTLGGPQSAGGRVVFARQSFLAPPDLFILTLDGAGEEPRRLTSLNQARLSELDLGTVGEATFEGAGGEPVHMHLVFPPGFDPRRKYPLIHVIHGGPHAMSMDDFSQYWNGALLAARGYVVAMVNFHGSSGYGQDFADSILGNHADKPFEDIMKATDWLIAQGYVDEKRMAAGGGSYGGYLANWILGHTDRFAALISFAGVYDLMGQFASDTTYTRPISYGASPWTDPARIDLYSPSRFAASFATPTLILHGEKDYRVPVTQAINLHGVLQAKGVPSRIVIFPEEGHGEMRPQGAVLWWKEIFAWLDRHLS
jgi:dipeptidyl aminopeptidase/acylaminoacyl peptidase